MQLNDNSRIIISGLSGDSGKTVVSCGFLASFKNRGLNVASFKKGPDYIDSAWLTLASGKPARNLDTYLMGFSNVKKSFIKNSVDNGINVVEGNRGLFDGFDSHGTHSTAELAKLLKSPVIIVQNVTKVTRTAAASILGCINFDPELEISGVILNQVAGERHGRVASAAIEDMTGVPVLGSIPKLKGKYILPSRHLGLITPAEYEKGSAIIEDLRKIIDDYIDVSRILEISNSLPLFEENDIEQTAINSEAVHSEIDIGYFNDKSFSFYYPENLELLKDQGANLIPISSEEDCSLGDIDALYIGGGFPETNLDALTVNENLKQKLKELVEDGLPVYAECGGLMYLAESVEWKGKTFPMSGVLPVNISMSEKPIGHGYCEALVDSDNPFFKTGTVLKGHEFHYSGISNYDLDINSSLFISRGTGCFNKRDGLTYKNV
ncbi:MAG: hydrogenobyrinic acid a,c-diamide synthase (glutamine-hydrolyzing), partial [Ignavibacteria bacterium]